MVDTWLLEPGASRGHKAQEGLGGLSSSAGLGWAGPSRAVVPQLSGSGRTARSPGGQVLGAQKPSQLQRPLALVTGEGTVEPCEGCRQHQKGRTLHFVFEAVFLAVEAAHADHGEVETRVNAGEEPESPFVALPGEQPLVLINVKEGRSQARYRSPRYESSVLPWAVGPRPRPLTAPPAPGPVCPLDGAHRHRCWEAVLDSVSLPWCRVPEGQSLCQGIGISSKYTLVV